MNYLFIFVFKNIIIILGNEFVYNFISFQLLFIHIHIHVPFNKIIKVVTTNIRNLFFINILSFQNIFMIIIIINCIFNFIYFYLIYRFNAIDFTIIFVIKSNIFSFINLRIRTYYNILINFFILLNSISILM